MSRSVRRSRSRRPAGRWRETLDSVGAVALALFLALLIRTLLFQPFTIPSESEEPNLYKGDYIIVTKWSYGYSYHSILFSPHLFDGRILFTPPKRGDIVVFKLPSSGNEDYVKRLIGLPGDRIQVRRGQLFINGKATPEQLVRRITTADRRNAFDEPIAETATIERETDPEGRSYLIQTHGGGEPQDNTGVFVVPPHCYFMMGDNRDNSADSRFDPDIPPGDPRLQGCAWDPRLDFAAPNYANVGFVPEVDLVGRARLVLISWTDKASLWKPWTWVTQLRPSRFFTWLR